MTYVYGKLAFLVAVYSIIVILSILIEATSIIRHAQDAKLKRQAKTLLLGIGLTIAHAVIFVVLLPSLFGQKTYFYALGYVAPYYLLSFTGYGLLRQGLFDIRAIAARSLAYILSLSVTSMLYVLPAVFLSTYLLDAPLQANTVLSLALVTLVVAALFQPLRNYFNKATNRFFYRDYYDPQDVLDGLGGILVGSVDITRILARSKSILEGSIRPTSVRFLLIPNIKELEVEKARLLRSLTHINGNLVVAGELGGHPLLNEELAKQEIAIAARLRTAHEDLGFLVMGPRRSGAPYTSGDRRLLSVFADELAVGLQNALRFEEIEQFNATLQRKIEEATRKLRQTNEKLRILDQTKDDFISMASHQLRTPLTSVKGYVSMVLDGDGGKINETQRKLLTQSFLSAQRMVYLISDLLNVSRLKTGKFVIEPVPCDLSKVISEEVEQLFETVKGRGLELKFHKPDNFPVLMLDETKLRQVLMNFIDNAVYYTPTGGHINVYLLDRPDSIEFTVVDDGIGVPRHEQHHLFNKFYRANNAKRARPDGTGLGIFMAKKVIIAQGGAIIFKSTEGKGSTFGFTFPKSKLTEAPKEEPKKA